MTVREVILLGALAALGAYSFREELAWTRRRQGQMRAREVQVVLEVRRLRQQARALRAEARALHGDPYYVERMVREDLRWQAVAPGPIVHPVDVPVLGDAPGLLAQRAPDLGPTAPRPPAPPAPGPPTPGPAPPAPAPQADRDQQLLTALGYTSVVHFQRKMMQGQPSRQLDDATRQRVQRMAASLRRAGHTSVKAFQTAQGLTADGIYGRKTEQAVIRELRRGQSVLVEGGSSAAGNGG